MQHPRCSKDNHRPWIIDVSPVKCLDVLELKHVSLHKSVFNLLTSPGDEQFVIVVSLKGKAGHIQNLL